MKDSTREISPLRQRMLEDMRLRKLAPHTQAAYVRAVRRLAGYLRRPPDTATVEELRKFQLHLVDQGTSPITLNATITGLKFFFDVTLDRNDLMSKMKPVFVPRTLPVVLSREEVSSLIVATKNLKHQTALSIAYGAGLRASEVSALKVGDVDSARMTLRIQQGKGGKDRYAMLSPVMLERLRTWWRVARAQGKMLDGGWLFPGGSRIHGEKARDFRRFTAMSYADTSTGTPIEDWLLKDTPASSRLCAMPQPSPRRRRRWIEEIRLIQPPQVRVTHWVPSPLAEDKVVIPRLPCRELDDRTAHRIRIAGASARGEWRGID